MSNAYGPGDSGRVIPLFIENAFLDRPLVLYGGTQILDFVWVQMTASRSTVLIESARQAEVSCFTADTTLAQKQFNLILPEDPLFGLRHVIDSARTL
jgi:dTDP-D-glucose 4,6-dehydratase